jgi:hypothetical protein
MNLTFQVKIDILLINLLSLWWQILDKTIKIVTQLTGAPPYHERWIFV